MIPLTPFKDRPLEERKPLVKAMVERMARAYGIKKSALPEFLGCTKGLVNNWTYYGRIPFDYLQACSVATGVSMDWLLHGTVPKQALAESDLMALQEMLLQVLKDGLDYGMIVENYPGALKQMSGKFSKDLEQLSQYLAEQKHL